MMESNVYKVHMNPYYIKSGRFMDDKDGFENFWR